MAENDTDLQKIKELIEIMKENDLLEIEIKHGDDKIFLKRSGPQPVSGGGAFVPSGGSGIPESGMVPAGVGLTAPGGANIAGALGQAQLTGQELVEIKSPIVGTFYATPSPDSESYVEIGLHIEPQTVVCLIEAMKVMNEIKAETTGTIVEILVTNGQAVEYGQTLFRVKPD